MGAVESYEQADEAAAPDGPHSRVVGPLAPNIGYVCDLQDKLGRW